MRGSGPRSLQRLALALQESNRITVRPRIHPRKHMCRRSCCTLENCVKTSGKILGRLYCILQSSLAIRLRGSRQAAGPSLRVVRGGDVVLWRRRDVRSEWSRRSSGSDGKTRERSRWPLGGLRLRCVGRHLHRNNPPDSVPTECGVQSVLTEVV